MSYGQSAIHSFLDSTNLEFIIRGHEEKADGLNVSKQARVLTVCQFIESNLLFCTFFFAFFTGVFYIGLLP